MSNKCLDDELYDIYFDDGKQIIERLIAIYKKGRTDRDKEIAEHNVFFSNKPIEELVLDARAEERANLLKEICEHERTMIDDDSKIHFVVKMVDVMKVFNKEQK